MVGFAGGLGALMLQLSSVHAAAPVAIQLSRAVGGPVDEDLQDGIQNGGVSEQAVASYIQKDGKTYAVVVWMDSDVPENLGPQQGKCSSFELTASGPVLVADQVYLTENENSDRNFCRPALISTGEHLVLGYGYAPNGGNTRSYARLINEMCQSVSETVKISNNDNENIGAVHYAAVSPTRVVATYYSNNGQESRARFLDLTANEIIKNDNLNILNPANIGRAPIAVTGDRALSCTGIGNNRPPEQGVKCTYLDTVSGQIIWKNQTLVEADPGNEIRYNQVEVKTLSAGRFAIMAQLTDADGKDNDNKGKNTAQIWIVEPTDDTLGIRAHHEFMDAIYHTHATLITGMVGDTGETALGVYEAPPTPSGNAVVSFLKYDPASLSFHMDAYTDQWIVSPLAADSGLLSNLYGGNPTTQGRNFLHGVGDVPNPGFGKEGGFMPEAETLFVMPYTGRSVTASEPKLASWVTFLPGKTAVPVVPENPEPAQTDQFNPQGVKPGAPQGNGNVGAPAPGSGVTPPAEEETPAIKSESAGGCSVQEGAAGSSSGFVALGIALLGLAASRRRKES